MTVASVPLEPGQVNQDWLISRATNLRSLDNAEILIGATDLESGTVLGGPSTLKAATDRGGTIVAEYSATGVAGAGTVYGILLNKVEGGGISGVAIKASGRFTFSAQPEADSVLAFNGVDFTAKASGATGAQYNIGASLAATLTNLATVLNASANAAINIATYTGTATTLEILHDTAGSAGNAYTTAVGTGTHNATALAATLQGGGYVASCAVVNSDAEVKPSLLHWFTGATADQKAAGLVALRALGIKARPAPVTEITT